MEPVSAPPPAPGPRQPLPARPKGSRVLTVLLAVVLVFSLLGNLVMLMLVALMGVGVAVSGGSASRHVETQTLRAGSSDVIAVVPVAGTVDETMYDQMFALCAYVKADRNIKAVVLQVDSPGGGVTASDEIHHLFAGLKTGGPERAGLKVVVSMRSLAASGGYYVSAGADKIYAEPTTLTGSIGVIWPAFEVSDLMKKVGVTPEIIKSDSSSGFKDAGGMFRPFTDQDRQYLKGLVNNAQDKFSAVVDSGRKGRLKKPIAEVAIGKIFTADEALDLGLIDEIAYLDDVCTKTAADVGLTNPTIVRLKIRIGLLEALTAAAPGGSPKVELKVDPSLVDDWMHPRIQYRAPEFP
jgi:protease IV